jgi:diguanylate cyclase (GGDEF)-like protein
VTVSVGVAEWNPQLREAEDLIALADTALYRAKSSGRNRVGR